MKNPITSFGIDPATFRLVAPPRTPNIPVRRLFNLGSLRHERFDKVEQRIFKHVINTSNVIILCVTKGPRAT
jgi:hypothetical protein